MKVLIASGGSGGHIFPAVSLAKELAKRDVEVIFVASRRRLDKKILSSSPYKIFYLSANPMPYKFGLSAPVFLLKLILDFFCSLYILFRFRPDYAVGFGGYTAGAIIAISRLLGKRTVIHEQNVVPGRTSRFLDKWVSCVAISFSETKKYFRNKNIVFTGNPMREDSLKECRAYAMDKFGLDRKAFTILVMGGSQGARSLNALTKDTLASFSEAEKKMIQVVHIAGSSDAGSFRDFYANSGMRGRVFEFVENINEAYSACDLAISRSGAAAISELVIFAKPMILIPYPSRNNNQRFNAMFLADREAAIYRDEKYLCKEELKGLLIELIRNKAKRRQLSMNAKKLMVINGSRRLAELVLRGGKSDGKAL